MQRVTLTVGVFLLVLGAPFFGFAQELDTARQQHALVDLNGDGVHDVVNLDADAFQLLINEQMFDVYGEMYWGMAFVDIDTTDNNAEVAVYHSTEGDTTEIRLFGYFDGELVELESLYSHSEVVFNGDGTVVTGEWEGFWTSTHLLQLDRATLSWTRIPQDFLYVSRDYDLLQSLSLFTSRTDESVIATVPAGGTITIVLTDSDRQWYLVRTPEGLLGWIPLSMLTEETFDGFVWAG